MFLSLGRLLYKKHLLLNLILVAQLSVALLIGNILVGNYNKTAAPVSFLDAFDAKTSFFRPVTIGTHYAPNIDYALLAKEQTTIEFLSQNIETASANIYCYGPKTCNVLKKQLQIGQWALHKDSDKINCVTIGNAYSVGDCFTEQIGKKTFSFKVTGTLGTKALIVNATRSSSFMRANTLLTEYDSSKLGTAIICSSELVAAETVSYGNALVFDLTENTAKHLVDKGQLSSITEIKNNSREELRLTVQSFLPLAICFGTCGFLSVVSMTCLNLLKDKKVYDVYFVCGMNRKDAFGLNSGFMFWIVASVVVFTLFLYIICNIFGIIGEADYLVKSNQFILSALYLLLLAVITALLSLAVTKRHNISES